MNPAMNLALLRSPGLSSVGSMIQLMLTHCEKLKGDAVWVRHKVVREQ